MFYSQFVQHEAAKVKALHWLLLLSLTLSCSPASTPVEDPDISTGSGDSLGDGADDEQVDDEQVDDEQVDDEQVDDEQVDDEQVDDEQVDDDDDEAACGANQIGTSEERVRYAASTADFGDVCESEQQARECKVEGWTAWTGNFTHESCQLAAGDCADGQQETRLRYATSQVPFGDSCQSEEQTRSCSDGVWGTYRGTYEEPSCEVEDPSCPVEGAEESRVFYESSSVPFGQSCESEEQTRNCSTGEWSDWSGSFTHSSCSVAFPVDCGPTEHGDQEVRTRYAAASVPFGESCQSEQQSRTCENGDWLSWSGSFTHSSCSVEPAASCDGEPHSTVQTRERFLAATIPIGDLCQMEEQMRSCENGSWTIWSGTFAEETCTEGECASEERRCTGEQPQACSATGYFQNDGDVCTTEGQVCGATFECVDPPAPVLLDLGVNGGCVVKSDGALACFGLSNLTPTSSLPAAAISVAVGSSHVCALLTTGSVYCWGTGSNGRLGDGLNAKSSAPVAVTGITTATAIASSGPHTCALVGAGEVKCWGVNLYGQLGHGETGGSASTPVDVVGISDAIGISAGNDHSCAILADGTVACWGRGTSIGGIMGSDVPVVVNGIDDAVAITSSPAQLGSISSVHGCALLSDGDVRCWGQNIELQCGTTGTAEAAVEAGVGPSLSVSAGGKHTCAVLVDGTVRCFGQNNEGQLGNGNQTDSTSGSLVQTVSGLTDVVQVAAGANHTCALRDGGEVWCWGSNGPDIDKLGVPGFDEERSTIPVRATVFD